MTAITENDLKKLEDLIVNGQSEIKSDIKSLSAKLENIDKQLTSIETRLEDWKPSIDKTADLAEKVGELKNWKQIGVVLITAFISSILSGLIGGVIGWLIRSAKI
jgi:DNA repair exonuclease SbcCD ATPase subunit